MVDGTDSVHRCLLYAQVELGLEEACHPEAQHGRIFRVAVTRAAGGNRGWHVLFEVDGTSFQAAGPLPTQRAARTCARAIRIRAERRLRDVLTRALVSQGRRVVEWLPPGDGADGRVSGSSGTR